MYELHNSLAKIEQNNLSIVEYYEKLKTVWDKLQVLESCLDYTCGAMLKCSCNLLKKDFEAAETNKLIQFICRLNKSYDEVKTNILSIKTLPTMLMTYHILQ